VRAILTILLSLFLCSCIELTSITTDKSQEGIIEFFVKKEGLVFKTERAVSWLEVYTDSNNERKILWSIVSNKEAPKTGTYNLPKPKSIVYGVVPDGYVEKIAARALDANIEYRIMVSGPGYGASGSFLVEK